MSDVQVPITDANDVDIGHMLTALHLPCRRTPLQLHGVQRITGGMPRSTVVFNTVDTVQDFLGIQDVQLRDISGKLLVDNRCPDCVLQELKVKTQLGIGSGCKDSLQPCLSGFAQLHLLPGSAEVLGFNVPLSLFLPYSVVLSSFGINSGKGIGHIEDTVVFNFNLNYNTSANQSCPTFNVSALDQAPMFIKASGDMRLLGNMAHSSSDITLVNGVPSGVQTELDTRSFRLGPMTFSPPQAPDTMSQGQLLVRISASLQQTDVPIDLHGAMEITNKITSNSTMAHLNSTGFYANGNGNMLFTASTFTLQTNYIYNSYGRRVINWRHLKVHASLDQVVLSRLEEEVLKVLNSAQQRLQEAVKTAEEALREAAQVAGKSTTGLANDLLGRKNRLSAISGVLISDIQIHRVECHAKLHHLNFNTPVDSHVHMQVSATTATLNLAINLNEPPVAGSAIARERFPEFF